MGVSVERGADNLLLAALQTQPIIAAAKDEHGLCQALQSECTVVFVLYGRVADIAAIIGKIKAANKLAMVHIDLIEGLSAREAAVDFIISYTKADGVISTKPAIIKYAKSKGLLTVQRFFVLDSISLANINNQQLACADAVEILPGVMPKIIKFVCADIQKPVIAGGLITDKEDVMNALSAGALAVSTTNKAVWNY